MGGFAFYGTEYNDTPTVEESLFELSTNPRFVLDVPNLETLTYILKYFPHILSDIPEEEILDRAESSSLSKAVLIIQVAWFCMNCASRLFQRLPLSLLEVSTAAHAFCTLLTYFVWWSKPLNVAAPTIMRGKEAREVYALLRCSYVEYNKALEMAQKRAAGEFSTPEGTHMSEKIVLASNALQHLLPTPERPLVHFRGPFRTPSQKLVPGAIENSSGEPLYELMTLAISPALYGFIHFLAWSDQFPTPLEQLIWRLSSFMVTCSGLLSVFIIYLVQLRSLSRRFPIFHRAAVRWLIWYRLTMDVSRFLEWSLSICSIMIATAHIFTSGFLIVESFRQLFFLAPAAYQLPSWSNYLPHLS